MSTHPQGVVTFLFSDVEGSTRLTQELGDARWAQLLEEHQRILRQAFAGHAGHEVDTQGDAFFVVFAKPTDAMAAAVEGQRALEEHAWPEGARVRVRIGLHTGEALARAEQYVGQEVHRASRICDSGHGGQILLSQTTAELARSSLPSGAVLSELGRHRLKDLGDPELLFQLDAPGLPSDFPRLRSLDAPHNLPTERTSFIGRENEIAAVRKRIEEHHLVTLLAVGGSGKTRLALRVGALALGSFPDGVFFVDLAPVSDPDLVPQTVAAACGLSFGDGLGGSSSSSEEQLVRSLARWKCLLVLDNCEHLLDAVAVLADRILRDCADVVVLATSREALGLDGEQIVSVPSLGMPDDLGEAENAEAVQLFVARAKAVKTSFGVDPENREAIVEICRRLDGIPLAIEFAASRVAHLSPQQISARLEDRFRLLTGGRARVQRQQTLAAALDWSHDLLEESERVVFRRLAVFAGGFELEAAETICSGEGIAEASVLDLLGSLVAKSLVMAAQDGLGESRFRLLETVRLYASEKLAAAGEAESLRSRHRDWYVGWLEAVAFERLSFDPVADRDMLSRLDNLRVAADWCIADERPDLLATLATRLFSFWAFGGTHEEGRRWLSQALAHEERLSKPARVACYAISAAVETSTLDRGRVVEYADRAVAVADGEPSPFLLIALQNRAFGNSVLGAFPDADPGIAIDARHDLESALAVAQSGLATEWLAYAHFQRAMTESNLGNHPAAKEAWETVIATCEHAREPGWILPAAWSGRAVTHHLLGEDEAALEAARRFLSLPNSIGQSFEFMRTAAPEVAPALVIGGDEERARQTLRDAARNVRRLGVLIAENHWLCMTGVVEFLQGRPENAGRLLAASRQLGGAAGRAIPFRTPGNMSLYREYLPRVREALGPEAARRARDEGRAMTMDEAMAFGLSCLGESEPHAS